MRHQRGADPAAAAALVLRRNDKTFVNALPLGPVAADYIEHAAGRARNDQPDGARRIFVLCAEICRRPHKRNTPQPQLKKPTPVHPNCPAGTHCAVCYRRRGGPSMAGFATALGNCLMILPAPSTAASINCSPTRPSRHSDCDRELPERIQAKLY